MSQTEDPIRGRAACDKELHPYIDEMKEPFHLTDNDIEKPRPDIGKSVKDLQTKYQTHIGRGMLHHKTIKLNDQDGKPFELSIFTPEDKPAPQGGRPCLYFIHGGGFVINNRCSGVDSIFECIAGLNAVCVSVGYSLAPGSKAPAQVKQCYAGLVKFFDDKGSGHINFDKLAVIGRSAGAALLVGLNFMIRERTDIKIKCNVMSFPFLDNRCASTSYEEFSEAPFLTRYMAKFFWEKYLVKGSEVSELIVPALATTEHLKGFPLPWWRER